MDSYHSPYQFNYVVEDQPYQSKTWTYQSDAESNQSEDQPHVRFDHQMGNHFRKQLQVPNIEELESEITGDWEYDVQMVSEWDPLSLRTLCLVEDEYIEDLCRSNDLWDLKFEELGVQAPDAPYPQILDNYILTKQIIQLAGESSEKDTYWLVNQPEEKLDLSEGASYVSIRYPDQSANNRFVYWPAYRVAGPIKDILYHFQDAGITQVTIKGRILPLTRDNILKTSIIP